jgi:hypothetical protein
MKKNMYKLMALFFALGLFTFSCNDATIEEPQIDSETIQDNAMTQKLIGDAFGFVNGGLSTPKKAPGDCPDITIELISKVMTITYPELGCLGLDGRTRAGIITATFDPNFQDNWTIGSYVTITFTNYSVDENVLEGTIVATCTALDPIPVFTIASDGIMSLTFSDQKTLTFEFETQYAMLAGFSTPFVKTDDSWEINGLTEGTARNGNLFSTQSINLVTSSDCNYFISGILNLTIGDNDVYNIEFIQPCGTITITYKGVSFNKTLQ